MVSPIRRRALLNRPYWATCSLSNPTSWSPQGRSSFCSHCSRSSCCSARWSHGCSVFLSVGAGQHLRVRRATTRRGGEEALIGSFAAVSDRSVHDLKGLWVRQLQRSER